MLNPDWTYNYLSGAQSAVNLHAVLPDDDADTILSVASFESELKEELPVAPESVYKSTYRCLLGNITDGFLVGATTAGLFSVFPFLVRGKLKDAAKAPFNSGNLKISIFFGLLLGIYNTGRFHVRVSLNGHKPTQRVLRAMVAIGIGYSAALLSNRIRKFIALFLLSRAIETKSKDIHRRLSPETQAKLAPLTAHADIALATVSMAVNSSAWIMSPDLLDKSYLRFLDSNCGYTVAQLRQTPKLFTGELKPSRYCEILHPHAPHGCLVEQGKFAVRHYFTDSLKFYYKLYAIPLLIATIKKRKLTITALKYFVQRTAQSAAFFTSGGLVMTSVFCIFSGLGLSASPALPIASGMSAGMLVCIEPKSRRLELGLYLFTQAMHAAAMFYATRTSWWYPPGADLLAIAIGFYQLAAAYESSQHDTEENQLLRPFYVSTLKKVFDYEEPETGDLSKKKFQDRLHAWSVSKFF